MFHYFLNIARNFRPADLVDILIISGLLYGVLVWFRHAASRFVILGIALLGIVYILSKSFQLYLTAVVLQGFFAVLLVALVVIFQEELRRFFERLATVGLARKNGPGNEKTARQIEILSNTAVKLARQRFGALMVLPGSEPLDRHVDGGVPLDGILSEPLLESLFDPHSSGHDGAVIIHGDRVVRFGCHLPLSTNGPAFGLAGLRHTAALGLAERTDALAVVVSEERGSVSVARDGRIRRLDDVNELKDALETFFPKAAPDKKTRILWGVFEKNPAEKFLALALASLLWLAFGQRTELIRKDFTVPIEYKNAVPGWVITEPEIKEARVTLSGPEQAFRLLAPETLGVSVDLSRLEEGMQEIVLSRDCMRIPADLFLEAVKPDRVSLEAYKLKPLQVPVELKTTGAVPEGYTLLGITLVPGSVTVKAPPGTKAESVKITMDPLNLATVTENMIAPVNLRYPADLRFEGGAPPQVQAQVRVEGSPGPRPPSPASAAQEPPQ
jgi:uncharacterized protein (TIGR00159 family)